MIVAPSLTLNATPTSKFAISVDSVSNTNGTPGLAINFNPDQSYTWTLVRTTGGISGFNSDAFDIVTAGRFLNPTSGGSFSVGLSADSLELQLIFTPVPEPASVLLAAAGGLGVVQVVRRRVRQRRTAQAVTI